MFLKHIISSQVRDELICAKSDLINSAPNLAVSYQGHRLLPGFGVIADKIVYRVYEISSYRP